MSMDEKIDKALKINSLFGAFCEKLESESAKVDSGTEFLKGYRQCLLDILSGIEKDEESEIMMIIKTKVQNDTKKKIYSEILTAVCALQNGFKQALGE